MRSPIYLDGFATTPLAPEALTMMKMAWMEPMNAGSQHQGGARASLFVEAGRKTVADLIHAIPGEIIFTSGATESNNLAIQGIAKWALAGGSPKRQIIVSAIEHKSVLETARALRAYGFKILVAPVTPQGVVDQNYLSSLINDETLLVSIMHVNNETGVIQPIKDTCILTHARGALFHCDAAQAVGKIDVDVLDLDVDYLSLSSHKMYGPAGVGGLYVSATAPRPMPLMHGGGQERGFRSGTVPVALIAGFGEAARIAADQRISDGLRLAQQETLLLQCLRKHDIAFRITSGSAKRLAGALNILIEGYNADDIVDKISRYVSLSTGSACNAGQVTPSHVLKEMGINTETSRNSIRICLNRYTKNKDLELAAEYLSTIINN